MIICRDWFISFVGVALLVCNLCAGSEFTFTLKPSVIKPGEHVTLEIYLPLDKVLTSLGANEEIAPTVNDELLRQSKTLKVLSMDNRREKESLVWRYELTSYDEGKVLVPPVNIQVGPNNFSTQSSPLEVSGTRAPTDQEVRPEFESLNYPRHWGRYIAYAFLATVALGFVAWGRKHIPKIRRPTPTAIKPPPPRPVDPDAWLREQLTKLKRDIDGNRQEFYGIDQLTVLLRRYFAIRLGKPVDAWTSREFKALLASDSTARELSRIFELCDEIKFRENKPTDVRRKAMEWLAESEKIVFHVATT